MWNVMSMISIDNKDCFCCLLFFQSMFFFLVQTEQGDIFKITMEVDEDMVSAMLFFNVYRFYKRILATQIFFTFSHTGYWNPHEVFWHCSCCGSHVCPQDRLSFYCLRIWKSVCTFDQQINNYSILSKLQSTTLYLEMHLLLFICYISTSFFLRFCCYF